MGRFSPTVQAVPFTGIGDALREGLGQFQQSRLLRRQRDLEAYNTGFGISMPDQNTPAPAPASPASQAGVGDALRAQQAPSVTPEIAGAPAPTHPGQPPLAAAQVPQSDVGNALRADQPGTPAGPVGAQGLPSMVRLPSGAMVPTMMTPFGRSMQQAQLANALRSVEAQKDLAQADEFSANAYKARREGGRLQLGDAGFAPATAGVAAATKAATLPYDIQEAVAKGQIDQQTGLVLARERGKIEAGLQSNQQTFTAGQNTLTRQAEAARQQTGITAETAKQQTGIAAEAAKQQAGIAATQAGSITTAIGRGLGILSKPRTPAQIQWDQKAADYKAANPNDPNADTFIAQNLGARPGATP